MACDAAVIYPVMPSIVPKTEIINSATSLIDAYAKTITKELYEEERRVANDAIDTTQK